MELEHPPLSLKITGNSRQHHAFLQRNFIFKSHLNLATLRERESNKFLSILLCARTSVVS